MKKIRLIIHGANKYRDRQKLVDILVRRSGWDYDRVRKFLAQNEFVSFSNQSKSEVKSILEELDRAGFQLELTENFDEIRAEIMMSDENILGEIKEILTEIGEGKLFRIQAQLKDVSDRLKRVEAKQAAGSESTLSDNAIFKKLVAGIFSEESQSRNVPVNVPSPKIYTPQPSKPQPQFHSLGEERKSTTEADIGKYWLSKIGIFTFLLGIVFLITYTSQFLGAWGKLAIGAFSGIVLAGIGNFLAKKEKYYHWAMSAIGGGWATLYFTVFAAYNVPAVKVISNPYLGVCLMLMIAGFFISQSLQFKSRVLAFMAYFLAYFAAISTGISLYTLFASYLLGLSAMIVTRKLGWSWLAMFCLFAVYGIHWFWVEPSLYMSGESYAPNRIWDLLIAPWSGAYTQVYPMIEATKSILHLSFLVLYWTLFTSLAMFRDREKDSPVIGTMTLINGLIFTFSFMHHLHVYYPEVKCIFAAGMGLIFLALSFLENKTKGSILSDLYLIFSISLFCLTLPMYFDGSSITYGWAAASVSLVWLGLRHARTVLRVMGNILAGIVFLRLVCFDYLDRASLLNSFLPINAFLFTGMFAGVSFCLIYYFYNKARQVSDDRKQFGVTFSFILAVITFCAAFLLGGTKDIASALFCGMTIFLMIQSPGHNRSLFHTTAFILSCFAFLRFLCVDSGYSFARLSEWPVLARYTGEVISISGLLGLAEWIRMRKDPEMPGWFFPYFSIGAVSLFIVLSIDPMIKSLLALLWGASAFLLIILGFAKRERLYRWIGLSVFGLVLGRLFLYDFGQMQLLQRIISFIGLGLVFIVASFIYNYYSKVFLSEQKS